MSGKKVASTSFDDKIKETFVRLDLDKSGGLSREELRVGLSDLKLPCADSDIDTLFEHIDKDKNGILSLPEFTAFAKKRQVKLKALFAELDVDKSGALSAEEVEASLVKTSLGDDDTAANVAAKLMQRIDKNHDGKIDYDEWLDLLLMAPSLRQDILFRYWSDASSIMLDDGVIVPPEHIKTWKEAIGPFASGAMAGVISRTATAPLERLKILYQTSHDKPPPFVQTMKNIYAEGGWRAFFRGNGANLIKVAPEMAVKMAAFDAFKGYFAEDDADITPGQRFIAGGMAGVVTHATLFPLEVIKIRLASTARSTYNGIFDVVNKTITQEGVRAMYKGLTPCLIQTLPHNGISLSTYETMKQELIKRKYFPEHPHAGQLFACTSVATIISQFCTYPLHVVMARLATDGIGGKPRRYTGQIDVLRKIIANEGPRGLYRGIAPTLMKSIPSSGITLVVYEFAKRFLGIEHKKHKH